MKVIVIGGGIAGCSTAYALAKRGFKITILERHAALCSEASGNPSAMLYPRLSGSDDLSRFALAGYQHSIQLFKTMGLSTHVFQQCGMSQLGFNAKELARIEKVASLYQGKGVCQLLNAEAASERAGIVLAYAALYFGDAGWITPCGLYPHLIAHKNISIKTLIKVSNILKYNNIYKVYDSKNDVFEADMVVIANANDAQYFTQSGHINTQANRGQMSFIHATTASQKLNHVICGDGYLSPAIDHQHSLGASYSSEDTSLQLNSIDHARNLQKLATISPSLQQTLSESALQSPAELSGRVSFRCTTPDYFPLLGQLLDNKALQRDPPRPSASPAHLPWLDGLYINAGHGSKGFTSAPLCAEILAALICKTPLPVSPEIAGHLNPNRFLLRQMGLKQLAKSIAISS